MEMALLVYRYTFALLDHAADIAAAQKVRLGYSTFPRSLASMGVLAGAVMARSLDQALRTYEAMVLRGYQGGLSLSPLPDMSRQELAIGDGYSAGHRNLLFCSGMVVEVIRKIAVQAVGIQFSYQEGTRALDDVEFLG